MLSRVTETAGHDIAVTVRLALLYNIAILPVSDFSLLLLFPWLLSCFTNE